MKKLQTIIFITILIAAASCSKVPVTNRKQMRLLPESLIMGLSLTAYSDFLASNPPVAATDANTIKVRNVGGKLKIAAIKYMKDNGLIKRIDNFKWDFNLVSNTSVNAWCMPGGKVVVYSGILDYTKDEDGLAVVMSHEIAHAIARHGNERMSQQLVAVMGGVSLSLALSQKPEETKNLFLMCYGVGSALGMLAYSRSHEYEADKIGMVFMALAGYDPSKAVDFWERMSKIEGTKLPQFLSTHPSDENRIKAIKAFLPTAQKYYTTETK